MPDIASIANILVALATAWLAWVTYGVAKTSRDALLLQTQPYLAFEQISLELGQLWSVGSNPFAPILRIGLVLSNPGKVAVSYEVEETQVMLNDAQLALGRHLSRGGRIFPDHKETFFLSTPTLSVAPHAGSSGNVQARILFWADSKRKQRLTLNYQFNIKSVTPTLTWEWLSIEVPTYESM